MAWWIVVVILLILLWRFGDLLISLIVRFAGFMLCIWLATRLQSGLASLLLGTGLVEEPLWAMVLAFLTLLVLFAVLFRWMLGRSDPQAMSDSEVLALDVGRVGLLVGLIGSSMLTFLCVLLGKPITVTVMTVCVIAAVAAALDVVCPSLLDRAATLSSDKSEWTKGGLR